MNKILSVFIATILLVGILSATAMACTQPPPSPPPIWIEFHDNNTAWITIHDYRTFGGAPGQFCGCVLNNLGGRIVSVDEFQILLASTGEPLPGFEFHLDENVQASFQERSEGIEFISGFISNVSQEIESGLLVDLQFLVTVEPNVTASELETAFLEGEGAVGTSEVDDGGNIVEGHDVIVQEFIRPTTTKNVPLLSLSYEGDTVINGEYNYSETKLLSIKINGGEETFIEMNRDGSFSLTLGFELQEGDIITLNVYERLEGEPPALIWCCTVSIVQARQEE